MAPKNITSEFDPAKNAGEKRLEKMLVTLAKQKDYKAIKLLSNIERGLPDRMVALPGGIAVFAELKTYGQGQSPIQVRQMGKLKKLGFHCFVVDSPASLESFFSECEKLVNSKNL